MSPLVNTAENQKLCGSISCSESLFFMHNTLFVPILRKQFQSGQPESGSLEESGSCSDATKVCNWFAIGHNQAREDRGRIRIQLARHSRSGKRTFQAIQMC